MDKYIQLNLVCQTRFSEVPFKTECFSPLFTSLSVPNIQIHSNYVRSVEIINLLIYILYRKSK